MEMKKHHKRAQRKLPFLKLCSCMVAEHDDFPDSAKPYIKAEKLSTSSSPPSSSVDNQETQIEGETVITQQDVSMITQKHTIEHEDPLEPAPDIEIPPPMPVQDHTIALGTTEITEKFASTLSLKTQQDCSLDLASEIENLVKQRMDPQPDTGQGSDSGGEGGEDCIQDKEAEKEKCLQKRQYVINELIETEQDYVKDLGSIVEGYMGYLNEQQLSDEMKEKCKIVFGNVHQIFDWHKETFKEELEKSIGDPDRIASLFTRYERRLSMYVKYCENKPKSEYIVSEYVDSFFEEIRQKLGHKLNIADLLIKPVQRIMKYQLILKDILKYTERAGLDTTALRKAYNVMLVVPKDANDMMQFGRLQGYDGKITAVGKLLLQDTLLVAETTNVGSGSKGNQLKFKERRVFLFEQIILFSEMTEKKRGNIVSAHYLFKNSLKVNKMSMTENVDNDPVRFMLKDQTPGADVKFLIQAPSEEVKRTWVTAVQKILEMQGDFLRALQSPIAFFNKEKVTKELSAPDLTNSNKDPHLRKTKSQPQPARGTNLSSPAKGHCHDDKGQGDPSQGDAHKHSRCKSVPTPLNQKVSIPGAEFRESSCPSSPIAECSKDFSQEKDGKSAVHNLSNMSISSESGDSTKPKKTIFEGFRNTLRKSKEGSAKPDNSYANSSDGNEEAEPRTSQGDIAPPTKQPNGAECLDNEQNLVSSRQKPAS